MASLAQPLRKKKSRQPAPTTILDLDDDLLCEEVFIRLPSLPSVVRAALACTAFLRAVRSSPAFRRRFSELHAPTILGTFAVEVKPGMPTFVPIRLLSGRGFDPDHGAALRGLDAFLTRLPDAIGDKEDDGQDTQNEEDGQDTQDTQDEDDGQDNQDEDDGQDTQDEEDNSQDTQDEDDGQDTEDGGQDTQDEYDGLYTDDEVDEDNEYEGWSIIGCHDGYVVLITPRRNAKKVAVYNPLTGAMHLFHGPPDELFSGKADFHLIPSSRADQRSFRLLCVCRRGVCKEDQGAFAVLSPEDNMGWQVTPTAGRLRDAVKGTLFNGSVYFRRVKKKGSRWYLLNNFHVLDTKTLQLSPIDLPGDVNQFESEAGGETSDGKPCLVSESCFELDVWSQRAAGDGVSEWTHEIFNLEGHMDALDLDTGVDSTLIVEAISRGTVYMTYYEGQPDSSRCCLLSFCLQTRELRNLCNTPTAVAHCYPYIMAWPPSFVRNI